MEYRHLSSGIQLNSTQKSRVRCKKQDESSQRRGQQAETKTTRKRWAKAASDNKMILQKQRGDQNGDVTQAAAEQRSRHLKPGTRRKIPGLRLAKINPRLKPRRPTYTYPRTLKGIVAMQMWNWSPATGTPSRSRRIKLTLNIKSRLLHLCDEEHQSFSQTWCRADGSAEDSERCKIQLR